MVRMESGTKASKMSGAQSHSTDLINGCVMLNLNLSLTLSWRRWRWVAVAVNQACVWWQAEMRVWDKTSLIGDPQYTKIDLYLLIADTSSSWQHGASPTCKKKNNPTRSEPNTQRAMKTPFAVALVSFTRQVKSDCKDHLIVIMLSTRKPFFGCNTSHPPPVKG